MTTRSLRSIAIMGALLAAAAPSDGTAVMSARPSVPEAIPVSALGNGTRARHRDKALADKAKQKRRRKLTLASKRRNRGRR